MSLSTDAIAASSNHRLDTFWAVVPAGGSGTRLWPLSRSNRPKFLLPLLGERSLIQMTVDRLAPLAGVERTLIVCGSSHVAGIARQVPDVPDRNLLVEPSPRGTGPAIGLAAAIIDRVDPTAVMGSFAADHNVTDIGRFEAAVETAVAAAREGWLVTLGLTPSRPETGYGYIERTDDRVVDVESGVAFRAARFVEKPDLARATEFLKSGLFSWNASMFIWSVRTFLDELRRVQPELAAGLDEIASAWGTPRWGEVLAARWPTLPEVTIDNGVMELASRVAVVPVEMGWSDVGDWHGLGELMSADELGNCGWGDHVHVDSRRNVVWSTSDKLIAMVGVEDMVLVETDDALLVVHRSAAQSVKDVVTKLKRDQRKGLT